MLACLIAYNNFDQVFTGFWIKNSLYCNGHKQKEIAFDSSN